MRLLTIESEYLENSYRETINIDNIDAITMGLSIVDTGFSIYVGSKNIKVDTENIIGYEYPLEDFIDYLSVKLITLKSDIHSFSDIVADYQDLLREET